jgi:hypothetical protein
VLAQGPNPDQIKVNEFLDEGAFAIACRGSIGSIDVVIKMLRHAPLEEMKNNFVRIGKQRRTISAPASYAYMTCFRSICRKRSG